MKERGRKYRLRGEREQNKGAILSTVTYSEENDYPHYEKVGNKYKIGEGEFVHCVKWQSYIYFCPEKKG